ncbi:Formin-E [Frankliniella fusca]|uniref:Formin-E n=1 Tax=Frankliniella fusca TaxID=407009 RepID=A0AAE1HNH0_9NEOP|nr:Formin-E [Frankliniella fusca]
MYCSERTFIDGDSVGDTVTGVQDDTGGTTGGVQGEHGLDGDVHGGAVEGLEHDLGHLFTVSLGVKGGLGEQDGVLLGGDTELVVEGVVPDLLHVIPVGDDTVLDGVLEGEDTSLGLGLVADVAVLLTHTDHHTLVTGATDDGGEDGAGRVVAGEAGLAHAGAIVHYERSNVVVTHLGCSQRILKVLSEKKDLQRTFRRLTEKPQEHLREIPGGFQQQGSQRIPEEFFDDCPNCSISFCTIIS